jgi:hypothetical protein
MYQSATRRTPTANKVTETMRRAFEQLVSFSFPLTMWSGYCNALNPPGHGTDQYCSLSTHDACCHGFRDHRQSNVRSSAKTVITHLCTVMTFQTAGTSPNGNMWRSKGRVLMQPATTAHITGARHAIQISILRLSTSITWKIQWYEEND